MKIYKPEIFESSRRTFNLKGDYPEPQATDEIAQVIQLKPLIKSRAGGNLNATHVIYTSASDKDTYITGFSFNYQKDVACPAVAMYMYCTVEGVTTYLAYERAITLTSGQRFFTLDLDRPIKIDRGTQILVSADSFAAGNIQLGGVVYFYEEAI